MLVFLNLLREQIVPKRFHLLGEEKNLQKTKALPIVQLVELAWAGSQMYPG